MRLTLAVAASAAVLLIAAVPAGAAQNLSGFPQTFPKAAALCAKAGKGKLGKKLTPSKGKVLAACAKLRQSYSDALTKLLATTDPLRMQMKAIVQAQRDACQAARRNRDRLGCRNAQLEARAKLASLRAQVIEAQKVARASYDQARKAFWATIRKLRGGAGVSPDAPVVETPVADVPQDSDLDQG